MDVPSTSTVRIAVEIEVTVRPAEARTEVTAFATVSEATVPINGKIHSSGLRYTSSRTITTMDSEISSSVFSLPMPPSALSAAAPVTSTCRPLPAWAVGPATALRMAATALLSAVAWSLVSAFTSTLNSAALPSFDHCTAPGWARCGTWP